MKKKKFKNYDKPNVIYNGKYSFYKLKFSFLAEFCNDLNKCNKLKNQKEKTPKKNSNVYDTAS